MERKDTYTQFKKLMTMKDKTDIVLIFDRKYSVLSITFLFCQERYIAIETYKDNNLRKVEVELDESIGHYLCCDFIDSSHIISAYRISPLTGESTILYDRIKYYMSLSDIEEKLKIAPGCLTIKE